MYKLLFIKITLATICGEGDLLNEALCSYFVMLKQMAAVSCRHLLLVAYSWLRQPCVRLP